MSVELIDAMRTTGTCRHYRDDPIPDEVLLRAFEAARFAPQGGNLQPLRWIVVRDEALRARLGELYRPLWRDYMATIGGRSMARTEGEPAAGARPHTLEAANFFAEHFHRVPAILVACVELRRLYATDAELGRLSIVGGASVYPQVQNVCLALRDQGIGTALTTLLCLREPEVCELLAIPDGIATACHVAAGFCTYPFPTRLTRLPVAATVFSDRYGEPAELGEG